ncbi:MAG TPA: hypothetical protein VE974_15865 [Thermoanaerobaculia bacterium]|nr:hypothetical protein [Thermoanaerobaculia bacterium]
MVRGIQGVSCRHASGQVRATFLFSFLLLLASAATATAGTFNAFGPRLYSRATAGPVPVTQTFSVLEPNTQYTLVIDQNSVSSAEVVLNGAVILGPSDFNGQVRTLSKPVVLAAENTLSVELRGGPNEGFRLSVTGVDNGLPVITATAAPPANAAGWNNGEVTVSFACSDAISGIDRCSAPVTASGEGAGQVITGDAFDLAGNTASATVTLNIDRTAPAITIATPANGATVAGSSASVSGTVADSLSGVTSISCNGAAAPVSAGAFTCTVALVPGQNVLSFATTDDAGNSASASLTVTAGNAAPIVLIDEPANLTFVNISPVTVRGSVSEAGATVKVGGIDAPLSNGRFSVQVPLVEGNNNITAVATGASGAAGTGSVQVTLDTTPPHVAIYSPEEGSVTTDDAVTISGLVNDIVVGTVNDQQATVTVNGINAQVANRSFLATNVPLEVGENDIRVTARDRVGNAYTAHLIVHRAVATNARIETVSGDAQAATIGALLPQPLTVRLVSALGLPVPNQPVVFRVAQSDGTLNDVAGSNASRSSVAVTSDAQGLAQVRYRLGTRAGAGNNRVEATATGFAGTAVFVVSATSAGAHAISFDAGAGQTGSVGRPLTFPFVAVVTDAGNNRLPNVPVTFRVRDGGGNLGGADQLSTLTDGDGRALAVLTVGNEPGYDNNTVEATALGVDTPVVFSASAKIPGSVADTRISGLVLDNSNLPLPDVTIRIYQAYQASNSNVPIPIGTPVVTDEHGQFVIAPAPVGAYKLVADGTTVQRPSIAYPSVEYDIVTVAGQDNTVGSPIFLPALDTVNRLCVSPTVGGTLTLTSVPGFSFTVPAGSATFPGGSRTGCITVTPVHSDKVPMVPGFGQQPRFVITIQPAGTHFNPPAQIQFPNVDGLAPRQVTEMYSYDHDLSAFVAIGTATVSADGSVLRSDPGVGVLKAGWHCGGNPNPTGTAATCPECKKCENGNCVADAAQNGNNCENNECKQCQNGNCVNRTSTAAAFAAAGAALGAQVAPSIPVGADWGLAYPEQVNITIDARCDNGVWRAILTGLTGDYSIQAQLVAGVQEVTGPPPGNTTQANYCQQMSDLHGQAPPGAQWYMLAAVVAHEQYHVTHFQPALVLAAPQIEPVVEALTVPIAPGKTRAQAITEIQALPGFAAARTQAQQFWLNHVLTLAAGDHGNPFGTGPAYQAELPIVQPMIAAICAYSRAPAQNWPACPPACP